MLSNYGDWSGMLMLNKTDVKVKSRFSILARRLHDFKTDIFWAAQSFGKL